MATDTGVVEKERPPVRKDITLPPVLAGFTKFGRPVVLELIDVRLTILNTVTAPTDFLKEPHCY